MNVSLLRSENMHVMRATDLWLLRSLPPYSGDAAEVACNDTPKVCYENLKVLASEKPEVGS